VRVPATRRNRLAALELIFDGGQPRHFQSALNFPPSLAELKQTDKTEGGKGSRREYRHSFDNRTRLPARLDRHIAHPPTVEVPAAKITIVELVLASVPDVMGTKKGDCIGPLYMFLRRPNSLSGHRRAPEPCIRFAGRHFFGKSRNQNHGVFICPPRLK
jgi:hypothetical protein